MSKPYSLETAPNGLQVLTVPRSGTEAVTTQLLFRAGSRYESAETNGLAHFNEHMVFKGGKRYPTFTAVSQAFDRMGAANNAFTGAEIVGYYAKTRAADALLALDVLSDVLTATAYDPKELDRERGVIVEEMNMREDDPAILLFDELESVIYGGHPLGRPTIGTKKNIRSFTPAQFRQFERKHQTPDRGLLVLAGQTKGIDRGKLRSLVSRFRGKSSVTPPPAKFKQTKPALRVRHKSTEQTHLGIALRGPSLADRDRDLLVRMLAQLLGGTMSSRLFVEVREKRGLAYYVRAMADPYTDTGSLVATAGVTRQKATHALTAMLNELKRIRDGDLTDDELSIHKESLLGRLALRWEDSMALAEYYGEQQLLLGEAIPTADLMKKIAKIKAADLIELGRDMVKDEGLNVAVIGPHQKAEFASKVTFSA